MDTTPSSDSIEVVNLFILFGRMTVTYEGRASSTLQEGSYLLIRKPDGSTMVHGSDLTVPLNYQPAGSRMYQQGWTLTVISKKEKMVVEVVEVLNIYRPREWSEHKIQIVRTEKELRNRLALDIHQYIPGVVEIYKEFPTEHGPVDLVAVDAAGVHHVFEVKRQAISINSVTQLRRYMEAMSPKVSIRGYVAAPTIQSNAAAYIAKHDISFIKVEHKRA